MDLKDYKKRQIEVDKYSDTLFNEESAKKSGYVVLGGKNHLIIEEAIKRVYKHMYARYEEHIKSKEFLESEEKELYKQSPLAYSISLGTQITIDLLKENGYLKSELGEYEENKLYDEFLINDDTVNCPYIYNPLSTLSNCLKHVIETCYKEHSNPIVDYKSPELDVIKMAYCGLAMNEMHKIGKYSSNQKYNEITDRTSFLFDNNINIEVVGKVHKDIGNWPKTLNYSLREILGKNTQRSKELESKLSRTSEFTVRDYLRDCCNLKDEKSNRKRVGKIIKNDMNALMSTQLDLTKYQFKKPIKFEYCKFNFVENCVVKNGKVFVKFTETFIMFLNKFAYFMDFPKEIFSLSRHAYPLAYKLYLQKNFLEKHISKNKGAKNSILLGTKTIIETMGSIPQKYEDLKQKRLAQLIIDPIEKYLEEMKEKGVINGWEYCGSKSAKLNDADVTKTYDTYKKALVKVTFPKKVSPSI